jgi:hypothetical protein
MHAFVLETAQMPQNCQNSAFFVIFFINLNLKEFFCLISRKATLLYGNFSQKLS